MADLKAPATERAKRSLGDAVPSMADMFGDAAIQFEAAVAGDDPVWSAVCGMRCVLFGMECSRFATLPTPLLDRLEAAIEAAQPVLMRETSGRVAPSDLDIGLGSLSGLLRLFRMSPDDVQAAIGPLDEDRVDHASALVDELDLLTRRRRIAARGNLLAGMIAAVNTDLRARGTLN
ncbi:hypothetical protein [Xanthobacter flavus]|uniref:hypothetical protein n=1 Tax=Xanthobacter flavus TaxID=281 RepID=UPI00372BEDAD